MALTTMNAERIQTHLDNMIYERDKMRAMLEVHAERGLRSDPETIVELRKLERKIVAFAEYWSLDYDA